MDNQQFYRNVAEAIDKLDKQGVPSRDMKGCFYKHPTENYCCIVGHMMPDDKTRIAADKTDGDNTSIRGLYSANFIWAKQFSYKQINLLMELQNIHDNIDPDSNTSEAGEEMRTVLSDYMEKESYAAI